MLYLTAYSNTTVASKNDSSIRVQARFIVFIINERRLATLGCESKFSLIEFSFLLNFKQPLTPI